MERTSRKRSGSQRRSKYHFSLKRKKVIEPDQYKRFEEVLEQINPFGVYQIFACFCIIFAQIEWSGNLSFVSIVGSTEPQWECLGTDGLKTIVNSTDPQKCDKLKACYNYTAVPNDAEFTSIVATFRLICEDSYKPEIIQMIQAAALFIGSVIGGHIGDWFGRQFGFYICQLGIAITSCMTIASTAWTGFAAAQFCNGILYGIIEVESITLMMEYTNNQYRMIPNACFQTNIANVVIALIAFLTKNWQMYFVFLNLVSLPIVMAFMLWHESPRWLLVKGKINAACNVLNDLTDKRWNGTEVKFNPQNLALIPRDEHQIVYNFYHLFEKKRFAKQSFMQILSMITYAIIFVCYLDVIRAFRGSSILIVFLDGAVRLIIPVIIIILDFQFKNFTRRLQFLSSLILIGIFLLVAIVLTVAGKPYNSTEVTIAITISAMLADSVFWMNIVQVTTQRYPTVIRGIAFGCLHGAKHIGTIIGILVLEPLLQSKFPAGGFIVPLGLVIVTLVLGAVLQPDTKGKALLDTIDEADYTRVESVLPLALMKMAAMHRVMQKELSQKLNEEKREEWAQWAHKLEVREEEERRASMLSQNTNQPTSDQHFDSFVPNRFDN
ncbi:MFS domain-containing protein [Aphelenchoides besseyi]|nr:MFS domain-containing protein [Aphelenchoides besseyi]KAI6200090.1 MFS domain-containing protein [Aphelenchoides besseyi]